MDDNQGLVDQLFDRLVELSATEQARIFTDEAIPESVRDRVLQLIAADRDARTKFLKPVLVGMSEKEQTRVITQATPAAARTVLHSVLAAQLGFISQAQSAQVMQDWAADRSRSVPEAIKAIAGHSEDEHRLLNALVENLLSRNNGDAIAALAVLSSDDSWVQSTGDDTPEDISACLSIIGATAVPRATTGTGQGARYRVLRPHARGGLGEVFVAHDEELSRDVALKEIQEHARSAENQKRFMREAQITGSLEHPGIVPIYGLGTYDDGRPYYAMRFVHGDSLKAAIKNFHADAPSLADRAVRFRELLQRFIDVCNAVHYAHTRGVLHRDLKPGNIMLGEFGETLVVDWGLARVMGEKDDEASVEHALPADVSDSATQTGQVVGTLAFMSPEQAAGKTNELGAASDIYSLGATLYTLLTGKNAFTLEDLQSTLSAIRDGKFQPPREIQQSVAKPLEAICLKAMSRDAAQRYDSAKALRDDLNRYLADEPVAAYQEPIHQRCLRWVRHHRTLATSLVVATILAAGAGLGLLEMQRRTDQRVLDQQVGTTVNSILTSDLGSVPAVAELPEKLRPQVSAELNTRLATASKEEVLRVNLARLDRTADCEAVLAQIPQLPLASLMAAGPVLKRNREFFAEPLWAVMKDEEAYSELQRRRALAVLARVDADAEAWSANDTAIAALCTSAPVEQSDAWLTAFDPVLSKLSPKLQELTTAGTTESQKIVALRFVAQSSTPERLVEMATKATPKQVVELLDPIKSRMEECKLLAVNALAKPLVRPALIQLPKDNSGVVPETLANKIKEYGGLVQEKFALAQTVPAQDVSQLAEELARYGYRPVCLRPFRRSDGVAAAVIWHRDGRRFKLLIGQSEADFVDAANQLAADETLAPLDTALYQATTGTIQFSALWEEKREGDPERKFAPSIPPVDVIKVANQYTADALRVFRNSEAFDRRGRGYRSMIFEKSTETVRDEVDTEGASYQALCLSGEFTDMRLLPSMMTTAQRYLRMLESAKDDSKLETPADKAAAFATIAKCTHYFGDLDASIEACKQALENQPDRAAEIKRLALLYSQKGEKAEAQKWTEAYSKQGTVVSTKALETRTQVLLGEPVSLEEIRELAASASDAADLVDVADSLAAAAGDLFGQNDNQANQLLSIVETTFQTLAAKVKGEELAELLKESHGLFAATYRPEFANAFGSAGIPRRSELTYRVFGKYETQVLEPGSLTLEQCEQLSADGYVPTVISAYQTDKQLPTSTSAWIRYAFSQSELEEQERHVANLTALLVMAKEKDWDALNDGMRMTTVDVLDHFEHEIPGLLTQYRQSPPDSDLRCNILTLLCGVDAKESKNEIDQFCTELLTDYANTTNPRLVGCIERFLLASDHGDELSRKMKSLQIADADVGDKRWYINCQSLRMVLVEPAAFEMGARQSERSLYKSSKFDDVARVKAQTNRPYYVAATETTLGQFLPFIKDAGLSIPDNLRNFVPTEECALGGMTMFRVAHYCNWLSKQAGLPETEWCYLPNKDGEFEAGMRPAPDFKNRMGYRLPDTIEWEQSARAGTSTIHYWGDGDLRQKQYSGTGNLTIPPRRYPPNPYGLFDVMGNVSERTQSPEAFKHGGYYADWYALQTSEDPWSLNQLFMTRSNFYSRLSDAWRRQCAVVRAENGVRVVRSASRVDEPDK